MKVQEKNGKYYYQFMISGKFFRGTCEAKNQKKAEKEADQIKAEMKQKYGLLQSVKNTKTLISIKEEELGLETNLTISEALNYYLQLKKDNLEGGKNKTKQIVSEFQKFLAENFVKEPLLAELKKQHVLDYRDYILKKGNKNSVINAKIQILKSIFNKSQERIGQTINPFSIESLKNDTSQHAIFSNQEVEQILAYYKKNSTQMYELCVCQASTGMACVDVCNLKWTEIDFSRNLIIKKRQKTGTAFTTFINKRLAEILEKLPRRSIYVFPELQKKYIFDQTSFAHKFKRDLKFGFFGFEGRNNLGIHSFRATLATNLIMNNIPVNQVQKILGHKKIDMTLYYGNHVDETMISTIQKLLN